MKKNKIFAIVMVMVMMFALAACGNKVEDTNNDVNGENIETSVTEESTIGENTLEVEEETVEPIYEEGTDVVLITNTDAWGDEYYDGKEIDMNALTPAGEKGTIGEEISVYNVVKQKIGHLKVGATVEVVTESNEWTYVSVYDGCYVVRTDELNKAMAVATEDNSATSKKESTSEKNEENTNETTYSVVDMSATKYAKQSVNIRKGPGTNYEKIGSLTMNQEVKVTGQADNGWYRISFNGGDAYVSNKYLVDNKIETNTNETTTNNGGNSDNGGENNNGSDDTTNNSNTDNGVGNNTPTPTTPTVDYSAEDVVNVIESTLRGAGFSKTTDVMTAEEIAMFGPTAGAGWGEEKVSLSNAQQIANGLVDFMNTLGYNTFYIEVLGMSDGVVTIRFYRCTF